jgi:hypothetical protein
MENLRKSPHCESCYPRRRPQGNLFFGVFDDKVTSIACSEILKSQRDASEQLQMMLKLRLLNKGWLRVISDTQEWFDHVCFKPGFNFDILHWESAPPMIKPWKRCRIHPVITIDEVLTDPRYSNNYNYRRGTPAKRVKEE